MERWLLGITKKTRSPELAVRSGQKISEDSKHASKVSLDSQLARHRDWVIGRLRVTCPRRPRNRPGIGPGIGEEGEGHRTGCGRAIGPQGLRKGQGQRSEGQDERGKAVGLQPMEIGAGFGTGFGRRKRWNA